MRARTTPLLFASLLASACPTPVEDAGQEKAPAATPPEATPPVDLDRFGASYDAGKKLLRAKGSALPAAGQAGLEHLATIAARSSADANLKKAYAELTGLKREDPRVLEAAARAREVSSVKNDAGRVTVTLETEVKEMRPPSAGDPRSLKLDEAGAASR
jgi:hypothetical protein